MASFNFIDFYIGYKNHPRFVDKKMIEDDLIRIIVQKYEMIVFTNKGEVLGDPNFGGDLPKLLFQTRVAAETVERNLLEQIFEYIPEITNLNFQLKVNFFADPENFQEILEIKFQLTDYEVYAIIK
jgi:phage baseplate assembly protein W